MLLHPFFGAVHNRQVQIGTFTGITLEASVQKVTLSPALEELEGSNVEPVFLVQGNVIAVERGCG